MTSAMSSVTIVSGTFSTIMEISVAASVAAELMICGMLWLNSCRSVSTSLV